MSENVVYTIDTCSVRHGGTVKRLKRNEPWPADDPFVKARPEFFAAEPDSRTALGEPPIERATANPC